MFVFRLWQTTGCKTFISHYFDPIYLKINTEGQRGLDRDLDKIQSKFFHNKATAALFETPKSYLTYFEPAFLLEVLSPLGLLLLMLSIKRGISKKDKKILAHFLLILASVALSISAYSPKNSFYVLSIILYTFTLWSVPYLAKSKIYVVLFLVLFAVSLMYFGYTWQLKTICNEIFFN